MTELIEYKPGTYGVESSMHKYGGWVIVLAGFFLAACLLAAIIIGTFTASAAGSAVDDAMRSAASDDVSVAGTQRNTTVIMGLVNIGSGNTRQASVTTTVQHKTANRSLDDNPWGVILVISLIILIAVIATLLLFADPHKGLA